MGMLTKEALLGASDLVEREVNLPSIGGSVRIRSLPAAYSNEATSKALELVTGSRGEQTAHINTQKLEILQVLHALVDPKLSSYEEASTFAQNCGPAWHALVKEIDAISGIDKEAIEKANATFPAGGEEPANGRAAGDRATAAGDR